MSNIWFTSDPHYFHKNISGPKVSIWKSGYRDFEDEKEMSRNIVKVWNQIVAEDDILYCLGDWSFSGIQNIWNFRKQLRCKNIHHIFGNHDLHIKANKQLEIPKDDRERLYELNIPDDFTKQFNGFSYINARDLFSSVQDTLLVKHGKHSFFLSHFAHRVWEGSHKGYIHLYGHSHSSLEKEPWGKSMDVGIDNAKKLLGEYRPFSIEEIISFMDKREIKFTDHHNQSTNV